MASDETNITGANDVRIVIGESQAGGDGSTLGSAVASDFEFTVSQDKPLQHGIGNEDPQGRVYGNREPTFSFSLTGEDAQVFTDIASENTVIDAILTGEEVKWRIKDLDYTEFSYSASDGEGVEFSADMNALDWEQEDISS